jgi:hypothetical protein
MNRGRIRSSTFFAAALVLATAMAASCSSHELAGIAQNCSLNSDCDSPLICVFSRCHDACKTSVDCPTGQRCVQSNVPSSMDGGLYNVCQLPTVESACPGGACAIASEVCGADQQCRAPCESSASCILGQMCLAIGSGASVCYDPSDSVDLVALSSADGGKGVSDAGTDGSAQDGGSGSSGGPDANVPSDGLGDSSQPLAADARSDATLALVPNPDAGSLGFAPTNFTLGSSDAGEGEGGVFGSASDVEISSTGNGLPSSAFVETIAQNDANATLADLYVFRSLTVDSTASLVLSGPRPMILVALTTVDIQGQVIVYAGGFGQGIGSTSTGPGFGPGSSSYCGVGGTGVGPNVSGMEPAVYAAGAPYGSATLSPLVGGSGLSGPSGACYGPVGGGGAVQIVAGMSIMVRQYAAINAGGGGGQCSGGGSSGGALLFEAPTVTIAGNLGANGGGGGGYAGGGSAATANSTPAPGGGAGTDAGVGVGGAGSAGAMTNGVDAIGGALGSGNDGAAGGGGGAGRIRINTTSGSATITGIVSPDLTTPCATQGTLQ